MIPSDLLANSLFSRVFSDHDALSFGPETTRLQGVSRAALIGWISGAGA
jgi:hypothetical protein